MDKKQNFFFKSANIFLHNKNLGILVILLMIAFGLLGFWLMPKQYNPEIVAPAFRITTDFPWATAEETYELITRPMENKVREIAAVDEIYSQTFPGRSVVVVNFDVGFSKQEAKVDLVQRMRSNMNEKPHGALDPMIEEIDVDDVPIVTLAVTSDKFSPQSLQSFGLDLADKMKYLKGVAKTQVRGGKHSDLVVNLDVEKLTHFNLTVAEVSQAITQNNLHNLNLELKDNQFNLPFRVYGQIEDSADLEDLVIKSSEGETVRIKDVAQVELTQANTTQYVNFTQKDKTQAAVFVGIAKQSGANATTVSRQVQKELDNLKQRGFIPEHVQIEVVRDDGQVAKDSVGNLTGSLIKSILIVVLVLLLFLNTRSALVVAVVIPLALLSVFGMGQLFGQTINRITLFALILSLGLLVDNATVVVENIYRLLKKKANQKREKVIATAVAEVGSGLVMSTITTVIAFITMAFVTGMMGPYMAPIPFFVPLAIVFSLFIALALTPFISNYFLKTEEDKGLISRWQKKIASLVHQVELAYANFLAKVFIQPKKEKIILAGAVILLLISVALPLVGLVKFRMLPKADRDQFYLYIDAPAATSVDKTYEVARKMEQELQKNEQVKSLQTTVGAPPIIDFNGMFKGSDGRMRQSQATIKVNLTHYKERKVTSEEIASEVRATLQPLALRENVKLKIIEDPPGPPVLSTYQLKIQGKERDSLPMLRATANDLLAKSSQIKGIVDLDVSSYEYGVEKTYRLNREKMSQLGVNQQAVFLALKTVTDQLKIDLFHDSLDNGQKFIQQHYIVLRAQTEDRNQLDDIGKINVRAKSGELVALAEILEEVTAPLDELVAADNQFPTIYVDGEMEKRGIVYASIDALRYLVKEYRLPSGEGQVKSWNLFGVTYLDEDGQSYRVQIGGEWQLTLEVFRDFGLAFLVAIFLIYFVLVAQFNSLRIPLYIMATIPLALVGVLPGFMLLYFTKGVYFNATSMIGVIALAGIVVNNAIIYLEYVFQKKAEGKRTERALIEAGKTRLLPIGLTSLTTILGSLTIISDPVWEGLAWAIITGLSLSAVLTLIILPVIYRRFEK